jgi:hypothetical protein
VVARAAVGEGGGGGGEQVAIFYFFGGCGNISDFRDFFYRAPPLPPSCYETSKNAAISKPSKKQKSEKGETKTEGNNATSVLFLDEPSCAFVTGPCFRVFELPLLI